MQKISVSYLYTYLLPHFVYTCCPTWTPAPDPVFIMIKCLFFLSDSARLCTGCLLFAAIPYPTLSYPALPYPTHPAPSTQHPAPSTQHPASRILSGSVTTVNYKPRNLPFFFLDSRWRRNVHLSDPVRACANQRQHIYSEKGEIAWTHQKNQKKIKKKLRDALEMICSGYG